MKSAANLIEQVPEILRRWDRRVRAEIPASRDQHTLVLQNNLGPLLGEVARALSPTGEPEITIEGLTLSQDHGNHRARLAEYSIAEMFLEYRLLRQTVLEVLDEQESLSPADREVINNTLERAMQDAVSQFSAVHNDVQRTRADEAQRVSEELRTLYEREKRITQVLQRPLMLHAAEDAVAGVSLATIYEPAWEEAEVGGDFFDVVPLSDGRVALVVGDACGKGIEAAVHNTQVKDVLRAFLREESQHPGTTLYRVNEVVCDTLAVDLSELAVTFVVLVLAVLDPQSGELLFSSAGAEPMVVIRASGEAEVLEQPGLPLGIQGKVPYRERSLRLEHGDTLVMVTDGITEARRSGGELLGHPGMVRLAQAALRAPSLREAGFQILEGARTFAGGPLSDDACLILARRR
jgi:serine phosphatase RsbU (regulator of sigma subunit)